MKSRTDYASKELWLEYLRTYFAAMAMQGLCARRGSWDNMNELANRAVEISDALISELNK